MPEHRPVWEFADAWVLGSIGVYGRPCTLVELIAAADWMNHAMLLKAEVESALGKLAGAGLARVMEDWTFDLTDEGAELWSQPATDVLARLQLVEEQLSAFDPQSRSVQLPREAMETALAEYRDRPLD
ncbi:MAG: hypothetical protein JWQ74_122 [Marmoricola sp.]|nr:hypothetical protein [Marmoricola sp.]